MRVPSLMRLAAAMLLSLAGGACAARSGPAPPVATPAGVRFVLQRPEATSVALAGSFNRWSISSHPLERNGARETWTIVVALPPGEHLFMYVVDGEEWISPPLAEDYADDGFGARNGIVVVRPAGR
jgi:1,4-alpha-glucan branching enzyme